MKSMINRLNVHTLILDLTSSIAELPELDGYHYRMLDEITMEIEVHQSQPLNMLFDLLGKQQIYVKSMRNKTNRLEELFVRLIANNKKGEPL